MKKIFLITFLLITTKGFTQMIVLDPALITALELNTGILKSSLNKIENEQKSIRRYQTSISAFLLKIEELDRKVYKSLKDVQSIIKDGKNIIYAAEITKDIYNYSQKTVSLVAKDPVLIAFAVKGSKNLARRVIDLSIYVKNALKGGEGNLMSNMDRQEIIRHVVNELRVLRGISYGIYRHLYWSQYGNRLQKLMAEYDIKSYTLDLIEKRQIVNNMKIW